MSPRPVPPGRDPARPHRGGRRVRRQRAGLRRVHLAHPGHPGRARAVLGPARAAAALPVRRRGRRAAAVRADRAPVRPGPRRAARRADRRRSGWPCWPSGLLTGAVLPAALGLVANGLGMGVWDVAMNVEGAAVEHRLGRSLMPRLHAVFSLGTVVGAGIGAATAAAGCRCPVQLIVIAALLPAVAVLVTRRSCRAGRRRPPAERAGFRGAGRLAGAAHAADRADGARVRLHRGLGQRLDRHRVRRRLRHQRAVGALAFGVFVGAMTSPGWSVARRWSGSAGSRCCG